MQERKKAGNNERKNMLDRERKNMLKPCKRMKERTY